jgi:hypothetical protein
VGLFLLHLFHKTRQMEKKIDNSQNISLKEVYTDALGNKWYCHNNILEISPARGLSAARADRYVGLKISENNLKDLLNVAIDGLNKDQDIVQAISILHELKHRQEFLCEENSILDLAGIYYFLQDENPDFPSEVHNQKKREIWSKDEICRGFFLQMGLALTTKFSNTPEEDLISFLKNLTTQEVADRIYKFIPRL